MTFFGELIYETNKTLWLKVGKKRRKKLSHGRVQTHDRQISRSALQRQCYNSITKLNLIDQLNYDLSGAHLKEDVDDEDVEDVLEWVDNTVEHSLQFRNSLDGLQRPKDSKNPERLDCAQILASWASPIGRDQHWKFERRHLNFKALKRIVALYWIKQWVYNEHTQGS